MFKANNLFLSVLFYLAIFLLPSNSAFSQSVTFEVTAMIDTNIFFSNGTRNSSLEGDIEQYILDALNSYEQIKASQGSLSRIDTFIGVYFTVSKPPDSSYYVLTMAQFLNFTTDANDPESKKIWMLRDIKSDYDTELAPVLSIMVDNFVNSLN